MWVDLCQGLQFYSNDTNVGYYANANSYGYYTSSSYVVKVSLTTEIISLILKVEYDFILFCYYLWYVCFTQLVKRKVLSGFQQIPNSWNCDDLSC